MAENSKKQQFNLRLNPVAEQQLEELAAHYNLSKAAIIKMAVSHLHRQYFPDAPPDADDLFADEAPPHPPPPTGTPPTPTGKG